MILTSAVMEIVLGGRGDILNESVNRTTQEYTKEPPS